jgi:hypothetical protein
MANRKSRIENHQSRITHHASRITGRKSQITMSTDLQSQIATPRTLTGEGWAAIAGAIGSAFLLVKRLASPKPAKPEHVSRAEFSAEMLATRECLHASHLAILEKLDANHRELLTALERLATRINALEAGLARVDERTRK